MIQSQSDCSGNYLALEAKRLNVHSFGRHSLAVASFYFLTGRLLESESLALVVDLDLPSFQPRFVFPYLCILVSVANFCPYVCQSRPG